MSQPSPLLPARQRAQDLADAGDAAGAVALLEFAIELGKVNLGEDDPGVLAAAHQLARIHLQSGEFSAARRVLEEAYAAGHWRLGDADPLMLQISYDLGVVAEELGNRHEARKAMSRVVQIGEPVLGDVHWAVVKARAYLYGNTDAVGAAPHSDHPRYGQHPADEPTLIQPVIPPQRTPRDVPPAQAAPPRYTNPLQAPPQAQPAPPMAQPVPPASQPLPPPPQPLPPPPQAQPALPTAQPVLPASRPLPPPAHPFSPDQPVDRPEPSEPAYRQRSPALFAAIAAVLAAIIAVAALVFALASRGGEPSQQPNQPVLGGGPPPADVRVQDFGTSVEISWTDPGPGRTSFIIAGGHPGEVLKPMGEVGPGQTTYRLQGLNNQLDYCFAVLAVYSTTEFASSAQTCTSRPEPRGSGS